MPIADGWITNHESRDEQDPEAALIMLFTLALASVFMRLIGRQPRSRSMWRAQSADSAAT
jgi:hypothetical protein